jgi:release factor glutamine methyltransferase
MDARPGIGFHPSQGHAMADAPTIRDLLAHASRRLDSRVDAEWLMLHAFDVDRAWLFAHALSPVAAEQAQRFDILVERRVGGEPVAYILGRKGFWSMDLQVTPATLIPRPETELLVELALERIPADMPVAVVDLGTGSGAIALALAKERPRARVLATDRSANALDIARGNAQRLGLERVAFAQGSWCAPLHGQRVDLIVSNPPYIEHDDVYLARGDLRFEPRDALASGVDGLEAIRDIVAHAGAHLSDGGWLLLEHGWKQGASVRLLLEESGFIDFFTARDLEGRERVSGGRVRSDQ